MRAGRRPGLNTFVAVLRDNDGERAHCGRIIAGREINLRAGPLSMQRDDAYGMRRPDIRPSEMSPDLIRVMEIELLGEIAAASDGSLQMCEPEQLPHTGQPVHELPAAVIPAILGLPAGDCGLHLGSIESGGSSVPFVLPNTALARHIFAGDDSDFRIPYAIAGHEEFLAFIPSLTPDQRDIVLPAYDGVFDMAMTALDKGEEINVPLGELTRRIRDIGRAIRSNASDRAAGRVEAAFRRSRLLTDQPVKWMETLTDHGIVNIHVGKLAQRERNLVTGATARILQTLRRNERVPPFVLVIDEAHLFLPGGGSVSPSTMVLREMIRTARHYAVGIVLLSQSPSSMDRQILLACNTRALFALDAEDLRAVEGQIGDLPEETIRRIPRMARGKAVFASGMDIMRYPVIVRIRGRRTTHTAETPDLAKAVREWQDRRNRQEKNGTERTRGGD